MTSLDTLSRTPLSPFGLLVEAPAGMSFADAPVQTLSSWTEESRVLVLRGFSLLAKQDFADYCRRWGEILSWDFGEVLDLVIQDNSNNYLFTNGAVPFHWDGAFAAVTPSFFFFQCLDAAEDAGGETVYCDTTMVYRDADPELRARWAEVSVTYATEKLAHYGGKVTKKLIAPHPRTGQPTIRFAEPLDPEHYLNPLSVEVDGIPATEVEDFLADLCERLHRPEYCYSHAWRPGDIVIADNHALVHGRIAFTGPTTRRLQRVQAV